MPIATAVEEVQARYHCGSLITVFKGMIEDKRLKEGSGLFEPALVEEIIAKSGEWSVYR